MFGSIVGIIAAVCAVWVIHDIFTKQKGMKDTEKFIWIVCAIVFLIITAIVYYIMKKH